MNIEYEISSAVLEEELENLTTHIAGHVYEQDDDGSRVSIAYIEASLVDVATAAEYDDAPLKEVFWRGSHELRGVHETFYQEASPAYQYLDSHLNWNWRMEKDHRNMLLIDLLSVTPAYRGQQLGLLAMYRTIQRFAGDAMLVVLDARPLQYRDTYKLSADLPLDKFTDNFDKVIAKLKFYFELFGFRSIPDSHYMVLNLDCKQPCIGDFCYPAKLEKGISVN